MCSSAENSLFAIVGIPKAHKMHHEKFGTSKTTRSEGICVLPLNIVNEVQIANGYRRQLEEAKRNIGKRFVVGF